MTTPPKTPEGYRRRKEDGILERENGVFRRGTVNEAVMDRGGNLKCLHNLSTWDKACGNTAKHDPDWQGNPTKCGVHSEAAKAKRKAKRDAKYAAWSAECDRKAALRNLDAEAPKIVRQIADGHNDPRALCADWVKRREDLASSGAGGQLWGPTGSDRPLRKFSPRAL